MYFVTIRISNVMSLYLEGEANVYLNFIFLAMPLKIWICLNICKLILFRDEYKSVFSNYTIIYSSKMVKFNFPFATIEKKFYIEIKEK